MTGENPLEKRLKIAATLIILGLLVEAICLLWARPLAFLVFVGIGMLLMFAGVAFYLISLVTIGAGPHQ
jgi:uncharacterized membrane protein YczE